MANGAELGTAFVHVVPSADGIKGSLAEIFDAESTQAGKQAGINIAGAIKRALMAAGIGKIFKDILGEGGALQQSYIGGIETLYGESADAMRQNAMAAAQFGISANNYAEQAVSFGAALKQSFKDAADETEAEAMAAQAANLAIIDMADNSAKFGTDITAVQNAYAGFAKQNYTMLDNLKLGYGGTKTEMERLLKDAEAISGIHYDLDNLADVYSAIHVIQDELGVTGTAANEAGDTLTGSLAAVKASLQNLYGSLALGADIQPALQALVDSVGNFLVNNLAPMAAQIIGALPTLFESITPAIKSGLDYLANNGESIGGFAVQFVGNLAKSLVTNLPQIAVAMIGAFGGILGGVLSGIGGLLDSTTTAAIDAIKAKINEYGIPQLLQKGVDVIKEFANGIIQGIPNLLAKIPEVFNNIKSAFTSMDWLSIGGNIVKGIANGIKNAGGLIVQAAKDAAKSAFEAAKNFLQIGSPSKLFEKQIGRQIDAGIAKGINSNVGMITGAMTDASEQAYFGLRAFDTSFDAMTGATNAGGITQNITINSPTELSPYEVARQTRNATQQMALQFAGVL